MTRINYRFFYLFFGVFFIATNSFAQTVNFDETWKEFLENNKISNMSALDKPSKYDDSLNYLKYLLMNTNSSLCQSEVEEAEELITEIQQADPNAFKLVPGFAEKLKDLDTKIKAYHSMDAIWQRFLQTNTVDLKELEAVKGAKTMCEKKTLAKYSYMTAYQNYCNGNIAVAKNIIETRTLRLAERTSLRVEDVEGLAPELAKMKKLFQNITKLQTSWKSYLKTGVSPGFDTELPIFPCNPIPNMKEWVLKGAADVCNAGPMMLEKIKDLQTESGVTLDRELAKKVKELEAGIGQNESKLAVLDKAWKAFIPDNEVKKEYRKYGFEYCNKEPLVRAYIMEGFANMCGNAEEMLQKIEDLQKSEPITLSEVTKNKIEDLADARLQYQYDEGEINKLWNKFVQQGDTLIQDYHLADYYCDHIYDVKSWLIQGLSGSCQEGIPYLEKIDEVKKNLEFEFAQDIRCRVEKLRVRVWDCRYESLKKLAIVQAESDSFEVVLAGLMKEYGLEERPEVCLEK